MRILSVACLGIAAIFSGCGTLQRTSLSIPSIPMNKETVLSNPVSVNSPDPEFLWNQIVDTVDDYFQIKTELRPRRDSTQWLEGKMETHPQIGATYLEPWRKDALEGFQRWQSTFQTMRRTANIRVIPVNEGFSVGVEVIKEIEDVDRSLHSSEGSASTRHDGTLARTDNQLLSAPLTLGWIRQENDTFLEQRILREIVSRATNIRPTRTRTIDRLFHFGR